jgi:dTDP-D-glucose 4,6-dehydratase
MLNLFGKTVTYWAPGTMFPEQRVYRTRKLFLKGIIKEATAKANDEEMRYNAIPFAFDIEGHDMRYYLPHMKLHHISEVEETSDNRILLANLRNNGYDYYVQSTEGWLATHPFDKKKHVLLKPTEL